MTKVVLVVGDDMGCSDLGCDGGEVATRRPEPDDVAPERTALAALQEAWPGRQHARVVGRRRRLPLCDRLRPGRCLPPLTS